MSMQLPEQLRPYEAEVKEWVKKGYIRDIQYSGPTYQLQIFDPEKKGDFWTFLHLDSKGQISDSFCSCDESQQETTHKHLAAAFIRIYRDSFLPLHQRFEGSLWNILCRFCFVEWGESPNALKKVEAGHYIAHIDGKKVYEIQARQADSVNRLRELIEVRPEETEETSLKFSNLPEEELKKWKEGNPSSTLKYELSFWSDLAKWLLFLSESGSTPKLGFTYEKEVPTALIVSFAQIELFFSLPERLLTRIVPTLPQYGSPLSVHSVEEESIEEIIYLVSEKILKVVPKKGAVIPKGADEKSVIHLEGWDLVPGYGFYAKDQHYLISLEKIEGKEIAKVLNEHFATVQHYLKGTKLYPELYHPSYLLTFDSQWNLSIECYLFEPGDITHSESAFFADWVYIHDQGFYHLDHPYFSEAKIEIPTDQVADFVRKERTWLSSQEGFRVHLEGIEKQLSYTLDPEKGLIFHLVVADTLGSAEVKELGPWLYVEGQGFYAKHTAQMALPFRLGIPIPTDRISLFIKNNRDELQHLQGFFSSRCPVDTLGLIFHLEEDRSLSISPHYTLLPEYVGKELTFCDDIIYSESEGFFELPHTMCLPEKWRYSVTMMPEKVSAFLETEFDQLLPFAVKIDPQLTFPKKLRLFVDNLEQKGEEYCARLRYSSELGDVPVIDLFKALKRKERFFFSPAGLIDLKRRRFNWLRLLRKDQVEEQVQFIRFSALELIRLNAIERMQFLSLDNRDYRLSKELLVGLVEFRVPSEPDLQGMKSLLRPYQSIGLNWLWFLYTHSLSGLLCDDMGLGKTHQAMALMLACHNQKKLEKKRVRFLVICPTSVMYHWEEKIEEHLSALRVFKFYGIDRDLQPFFDGYDVLLTSYGIWRNEKDRLSEIDFEIAVFDEIQVAKNHTSLLHASLLMARAKMRIGLTGTPIENRLRELKSLFDLVLPSYMPSQQEYRNFFLKPIEREGNIERKVLLSRFVKPFMLRRKKEDVLLDLPEKTEEIAHCQLLPEQRTLYQTVLNQSRERLLQELQDSSSPVPYLHVFALLSALKQICNHPAAYLRTPYDWRDHESGKWELFVELLSEARESKQKVVVFSQYLSMLDIIEDYLNANKILFAGIRGSTKDRKEQLQRFQKDPKCEVFVGSLQAAGLGIDLTAASVAIHYDRWWNAARENQATDRIHRIGQTRGVQVFKLVTKGTFEDRINEMILLKAGLLEEIVGVDDQNVLKRFDREEIIELLENVEAVVEEGG